MGDRRALGPVGWLASILQQCFRGSSTLTFDCFWDLVIAQTEENRLPHLTGIGPRHKRDFADQPGLQPMNGPIGCRPFLKRTPRLDQWVKPFPQLDQAPVSEAGAGMADIHKVAVIIET